MEIGQLHSDSRKSIRQLSWQLNRGLFGVPRRRVRAENPVHGSDQHVCSPGARPVMIIDHVHAVRVPPDHAASSVAAAIPAGGDMEDRRDLDPAPPARRLAAAAAAPPETELGGPGTPRDPAQRDTEGTPPRAAAAGHPGTTVRVCDLSRLIVWVMLALPGVVPGSG